MTIPLVEIKQTKHLIEDCNNLANKIAEAQVNFGSRERSIVLTKIQEARQWLQEELKIAMLQQESK